MGVKGCLSKTHGGLLGPPVDDLGNLGQLNLKTVVSAEQAYQDVLLSAGALPHDATSARMVSETRTGTGRQGYQADIDADRTALKFRPPMKDSDNDGLPDKWEKPQGLNPADATDSSQLSKSGYTHLERYCHERAESLIP